METASDSQLSAVRLTAAASGYHEDRDSTHQIRPHWQPFFDTIPDLTGPEFTHRWKDAQRIIRENGVTYNVYGDPNGLARPWQLDPVPLLLGPQEAHTLERGLTQRGLLLEKLLTDIYGEQRLLRDGLLPHELLYPNPGFLRPCHGLRPPNGRYLHLYAANLGRRSDGRWQVISDRTQAPSGAGYALENRIVVGRTLPEAFHRCKVQRLAVFFQTLIDTLRGLAPRNRDNPRVVLLTPGPYNETYFEHSYLARYLGYTLAEGGDLTVRDNRVYLKVLGGLQPVDVIFRRLDDDFCDPLELRPDSFLGVPGLMHAVRTGNVAVANAIGCGVLESPAFNAFLPKLCKHVLGEDLKLETVPTWWCGEPAAREYVLSHLADLVVKPAFPLAARGRRSLDWSNLTAVADRIRANPMGFVAQERVSLSAAPTLTPDGLQDRKLVLRLYLAAKGESFDMMPGGLTRVAATPNATEVSMQRGGGSKDTWVLTDGQVHTFTRLPPKDEPVVLTRGGGDVPSRAADNLFWLGRYAERAEGLGRLLRCILTRVSERGTAADTPELPALLRTLSAHTDNEPKTEADLLPLMYDTDETGSLSAALRDLHRVAGVVRDRISVDMWRVVSRSSRLAPAADGHTVAEALDHLDTTILRLAAFGGMAVECMTRSDGWRFLDLGRKLERGLHVCRLLRGVLGKYIPPEGVALDAVLEVCDSRMTYRRRYLGTLTATAVLDLVLADETNPRALAAQLADVLHDVDALPRPSLASRGIDQRLALEAVSAVRLAEVDRLALVVGGRRPALIDLLDKLSRWLPQLSDALTQQYLSHLQASRHLSALPPL